jgi:hypothetical protein
VHDVAWQPRLAFRAECVAGEKHAAPAAGCACGIYAAHTPTAASRYLLGRDDPTVVHRVVGLVALWGSVFEGIHGWRGALAYPARIWIPASPLTPTLAENLSIYGVPVDLLDERRSTEVAAALAA